MTTLHLGVIDLPYANAGSATTGDVAEILEAKYHVMEIFWQLHGQEVADAICNSMVGAFESRVLHGAPAGLDFYGTAMGVAKQLFSRFLESKEMDALGYPGVPTKAALTGVSHRFKKKRGAPGRPSFVDTGLFESSFRAWMEG